MAKVKIDTALIRLATLWNEATGKTIQVNLPETDLSTYSFNKTYTPQKKKYIPGNFVVVDPKFLNSLEAGELKMTIQIIAALKKNNALWYFEYRGTGRPERALLKLREKGLLYESGTSDIHIVNPFLIRKGKIESVIVTTYVAIEQNKALTKSMIKDLDPPDDAILNGFYALQV